MKKTVEKQMKRGLSLFTILVLSSSFALANFKNIDCEKDQEILDISTLECQVLESLWTRTKGENWIDNQNWDSLTNVSTWEGITLKEGAISSLLLYSNNLVGKIPSALGNLTHLERLSLFNNQLIGEVPPSLGALSKLTYLDLGDNHLTKIPESLGGLLDLRELYLNNNQFKGEIPETLGDLESLNVLKIYGNQLTGEIPSSFGALLNLESLSLAENHLTGAIPSELGALSNLSYMDLKSNRISESIPKSLGELESLTGLYLQNNHLTGAIPNELGDLVSLTDLDLSENQLLGTLPSSLGALSNLTYLNVAKNKLSGDLPLELLNLKRVNYLNLEGNSFEFSNIEPLYNELLTIPTFIVSPELEEQRELKRTYTDKVDKNASRITINLLNKEEIATFELVTLQLVGTKEAGESLVVSDEGKWSIEENTIVFTPMDGFTDVPTPVFYRIETNEGLLSNPVKVSIKRNKTESLKVLLLESNEQYKESNLFQFVLAENFLENHPYTTLSDDAKEVSVENEGIWRMEQNATVTFTPVEEFISNPSPMEYIIVSSNGEKRAIGKIEMRQNISNITSTESDSVGIFGLEGVLFMMLLSGLLGMFYTRKIEKA